MLYSICDVQELVASGQPLLLAGSEQALSQIAPGNWIGGTIPYFVGPDGGVCTESQVFVTRLPEAIHTQISEYTISNLPALCREGPENGFSFLIIPAGSQVHFAYAQDAPGYEQIFVKPVVGWVTGVLTSEIGKRPPKVFFGPQARASSDSAAVMHVTLPPQKMAQVDIVNVFSPGDGDAISFPFAGFQASQCFINGEPANFAQYLSDPRHDTKLPLVADYNGSFVNVCLQQVDLGRGMVKMYAPVFPGVTYRLAKPVGDYVAAFEAAIADHGNHANFSCNCILNYLYAGLEGRHTGPYTGPISFGEIAHQLLNQTLVKLVIRDI
jgi:hypothetical protein